MKLLFILNNLKKNSVQNSVSFFSAQMSSEQTVLYGDTVNFDQVIVNYGDDFISSGSVYL